MELHVCCEPNLGATYDDLLNAAATVERLGFSGFFRSDHVLPTDGSAGLPGPTDAWITLAGLARETERIRLGTLLTPVTFRHPAMLAITVAQVDAMSGGRIELGLGAGWFEAEHLAYGLPFPSPPERMTLLAEQLEIVTGLWDVPIGDVFRFSGSSFELAGAPGLPKPVQQPRPPVILGGGGGPRSLALAARYANEFNLAWRPLDECREIFNRLDDKLAKREIPRTVRRSMAQMVSVATTETEARAHAESAGLDAEFLRTRGLFGTSGQVVDRLHEFEEAGIDRVYLALPDVRRPQFLHHVADLVLPHFGARSGV